MNKKIILIVTGLYACMLTGCGHVHRVQGEEQGSEIPAGVRVSIGSSEIKSGEYLDVFKSECKYVRKNRGPKQKTCKDKKVGEAQVLKVLDHDAAIVEPEKGLVMDASMKVERKTN